MSSQKKTKKTSSKNSKRTVTLSDGTKIKTDSNASANIRKGQGGRHNIPKKPFSTETGIGYEDHEVTDNYDSHEYPPPSKNPEFRKFWVETLDNMINRENFKPAHLRLLEVYCRLCVELRRLEDFIMANGHTYRITTIAGEVRKTYPEVLEKHKILNALHKYATLLDLKPSKDKTKRGADPSEADEWD